jgi:hypothetical protein
MKILIYLLLGFFSDVPAELHDFHMSKTLVKHVQEEKTLQVTMHLFIDDFEEALSMSGVDSVFMCTKMENSDTDIFVQSYVRDRFFLEIEGKRVEFEYLGKEISESLDGVWLYMEAFDIDAPQDVKVTNKLLTEVFPDQKNIVNIRIDDREKMLLFSLDDGVKDVSWR